MCNTEEKCVKLNHNHSHKEPLALIQRSGSANIFKLSSYYRDISVHIKQQIITFVPIKVLGQEEEVVQKKKMVSLSTLSLVLINFHCKSNRCFSSQTSLINISCFTTELYSLNTYIAHDWFSVLTNEITLM